MRGMMKKLALVLGGGAAKGYCHIGVLKVLEEHGIRPDLIIGNSMGAIVGAMYACGYNAEALEKMAYSIQRKHILDFDLLWLFKKHLLSGKKLQKLMNKLFGDIEHSQTDIPFASVATCLDDGKLYVLNKGRVSQNVNASMSVPTIFRPVYIDGKHLVDGGVLNNIPDDIARQLLPDAVVLSIDPIGDYTPECYKLKIVETLANMIFLMQSTITSNKDCSDIRIRISQTDIKQIDFGAKTAKKSISAGEEHMRARINELIGLLGE